LNLETEIRCLYFSMGRKEEITVLHFNNFSVDGCGDE
jgi:hypothetical protein